MEGLLLVVPAMIVIDALLRLLPGAIDPLSGEEDVNRAVAAAKAAFEEWRRRLAR